MCKFVGELESCNFGKYPTTLKYLEHALLQEYKPRLRKEEVLACMKACNMGFKDKKYLQEVKINASQTLLVKEDWPQTLLNTDINDENKANSLFFAVPNRFKATRDVFHGKSRI